MRQETLLASLKALAKVQNKRSTLPMLHYAHLFPTGIYVTDLEVGAVIETPTGINAPVCVPLDAAIKVIGAFDKGEIALSRNDGEIVTIAQGKDKGKLMGMPIDEFPRFPDVGAMVPIADISAAELQAAFKRMEPRISLDANRLNITALLMRTDADQITLAATDGRRLRLEHIEAQIYHAGETLDCLIPHKAIENLIAMLPAKDKGAIVEIFADQKQIAFVFGEVVYVATLVDAQPPNIMCVIPQSFDTYAEVDVSALTKAVKKCQTIMTDRFNAVVLGFNGCLSVSVDVPEVGEMRSDVATLKIGPDIETCVNPDFLQDILKSAIGERLNIGLRVNALDLNEEPTISQAIVFTDPEKFDALEVLMPVRHK
jgi:DNA polymerase III sliding clamp (beta) subunit (PCNA family)